MIRLALAMGFFAVFGFVTIVITTLLKDYFNKKNKTNENEKH